MAFNKNNKLFKLRPIIIIILVFLAGILGRDLLPLSNSILIKGDMTGDPNTRLYLVTEVIDGDTIIVNGSTRVRLIDIDAPERDECYYDESKMALVNLVEGEYVRLEKDISGVDRFCRLLRYVFLPQGDLMDDTFVDNYMVEQVFADIRDLSQDRRYRSILIHGRNEAVAMEKGMWSACEQALVE